MTKKYLDRMTFKKIIFVLFALMSINSFGQIIYQHDFGTTTISAHPYTFAPTVFDANLNTSSWVNSNAAWTSFGGSTGQALSLNNSSGTPTITLTFNVAAGYQLSVASFDFWRQRSATGAQNWSMTINGIAVGSGTVPTSGAAIGTTAVSNAVNGLTGTITVVLSLSGATGTGTFRVDDFTLNGTVITSCTAPTTQATALAATAIGNFAGTVNWTRGNGNRVLVVARQGGAVNANPSSGTTYTASAAFGSGTQIGTGNYVVYDGVGTSVALTSLLENTAYHYAFYEYNTVGTCYLLTPSVGNFTTTRCSPTTQPNTFSNNTLTATTANLTWVRGNGANVIVVGKLGSAVDANPVTGTTYIANAAFGAGTQIGTGNYVLYIGPATSVALTALVGSTTYHFAIYEFNAPTCYNLAGVVQNFTTPAAVPAVNITDFAPQVAAANVPQGTLTHVLYRLRLDVTSAGTTFTGFNFTTAGTYAFGEVTNVRLRYSVDNILDAGDTPLGTIANAGTAGAKSFPAFSQAIANGATVYLFLTGDILATATIGNTIRVNAITAANLTFSAGTKTVVPAPTIGGVQTFIASTPNVPTSFTKVCSTNTTQVLSWAAPATGTFDGYILVVRAGAVPNAVTTIVASSQPFNLDYSLAPTYNASTSRVLYIGTGTTATVTGLTAGVSYTYALYSYKNNGASTIYSATATTATQIATLGNVSNGTATPGNSSGTLTWTNPSASCFNQVLVVVTSTAGITFVPTGNSPLAYVANPIFLGFNQALYYGSGNLVNITGLTNGVTYYLEIFVRIGSEWSSGIEVPLTPINVVPTVFKTGDLVLIAYNNNSSSGNDLLRLMTFVDINPGTKFLWANATYETGGNPAANVRTNKWFSCTTSPTGNLPYLEFTYTGATAIPAASTFCIETVVSGFSSTITAVSPAGVVFPNTSFTIVGKSADGSTGLVHGSVNVSTSSPDSMFLMQGNFSYDITGSSFVGNILSGIQDGGLWYNITDDLTAVSGNNYRKSRKHPQLICASIQANATPNPYQVSYNVAIGAGYTTNSKPNLITFITDYTTNWVTSFGVCPATSPFVIIPSPAFNQWNGNVSTNWFDCNNWSLRAVPDEQIDVSVLVASVRDAVIDYTAPFSDGYLDIAKCKSLTISGRKVQLEGSPLNRLQIYESLLISGSGVLDMDDGNNLTADGFLEIYKDWNNSVGVAAFLEGNGTVNFLGSSTQVINANVHTSPEEFYDVILDNDFNTLSSNNLIATNNLDISVNKTVTIGAADYIRVNNRLTNYGDITIQSNGQLIQVNFPDTNAGDYTGTKFTVRRDYTARDIDYVFWSAPTNAFTVASLPNGFRYEWNPTYPNANGTFGNWRPPSSASMTQGKGYIARTFNGSSTAATNTFSFTGKPNNGIVSIPIQRGNVQGPEVLAYPIATSVTKWDDNWNLVGNPFPSAINSLTFLAAINNPDIEGFVYIWTHGTVPTAAISSPFYDNFSINYSSDDYIIYNGVGTVAGPVGFNGKIASGQGFFVLMRDGPAATSSVTFNNSMRRNTGTNAAYSNSQFYRSTITEQVDSAEEERHRIWLDIISPANAVKRTLIGYVETATNGKDRLFDAVTKPHNLDLFSFVEDDPLQEYCIQGRPLPFDPNDSVNLGIKTATAGNYKIAIAAVDGLFSQDQPVYLEDKTLQIIHDLRLAPYAFDTAAGVDNTRFVLRYTTQSLSTTDFNVTNQVVITTNGTQILVNSKDEMIEQVQLFDVLGREIYTKKSLGSLSYTIPNTIKNQALIVKIVLHDGAVVSKKIIVN